MERKYIGVQPSADDTSKIGSRPGLLHTGKDIHCLRTDAAAVDSGGTEYELSINKDDWKRLEKIGMPYDESWDVYRLEFGENIRLVGRWLPGSDKLIDWEID